MVTGRYGVPLLGLAKSIYYYTAFNFFDPRVAAPLFCPEFPFYTPFHCLVPMRSSLLYGGARGVVGTTPHAPCLLALYRRLHEDEETPFHIYSGFCLLEIPFTLTN